MTSAPPRTHIISRTLIAVAAAVFACIASPALAVTLTEARRIPNPFWERTTIANEKGVLNASRRLAVNGELILDFVPLIGTPGRHVVTSPMPVVPLAAGSNGQEFLVIYLEIEPGSPEESSRVKGILLDSAGIPTRTVALPPYLRPWPTHSVVRATPEGFDVYFNHEMSVLRTSVRLDGTTSDTWATAATFDDEIGYFDVLNLPGGKILIHVLAVDRCRLCVCSPPFFPVRVAVTPRGEPVGPLDFAVLPPAAAPEVEVGRDGRIWLLAASAGLGLTEVREIVAPTGAPIFQSGVIATDTDGPGYNHYFRFLTRLSGGFVLTESGPGGEVASLRTDGGHEWERLLISSGKSVQAVLAGPGEGVAFLLLDQLTWEAEVRFLSLERSRGVPPKSRRVRPSRPE